MRKKWVLLGLFVAAALGAYQVFLVVQGGTGTSTIGGNDSLTSHLCKSTDGLKIVTCIPPTATATPTVTPTNTHTSTPTLTPTHTPTSNNTSTPTLTPTITLTPVIPHGGTFGSAVANEFLFGSTSSSYMTVPNDTALEATSGVSISVWVMIGRVTNTGGVFTKATAAGGSGAATCGDYTLEFDSASVINFGVNGSGSCSWGSIAGYTLAPAGATFDNFIRPYWIHFVGTYSKSQGDTRLYMNGVLRATGGAYSNDLNHTGTIAVLGAWKDKSVAANACRCAFDDLRIYKDAALTAGDVTTLYNGGRGSFPLNLLSANETLVWRFDEGSGTTATDSIGGLVLTGAGTTNPFWIRGIIPTQ